jgi:outer membrane lipoprotein-sorting protein
MSRRARWTVPAGAVVVVGGVLAGSMISVAEASPPLPARTPAQLLAAVAGTTSTPPFTGTVVETASLGLPALPGTDSPTSLASLLTGSHTIKVWYADPAHYRVSVPQSMSETDLIRNGSNAWMWDSSNNSVTHTTVQPHQAKKPASEAPLTPQQAANQVLARVGPTTTVGVDNNVTVAGEAAYQLELKPKSASSLVGQVRIAIDGQRDVPLRVQVFAKGAKTPAIQIGFTSVSFVRPAAANFSFTPPAGSKVEQEPFGSSQQPGQPDGSYMMGKDWLSVANLPSSVISGVQNDQSASPSGQGLGSGDSGAVVGALLKSATPVSGSWGSGRLLRTSLVSLLITDNGRVLVGAVTPSVLYADAAQPVQAPHSSAPKSK